MRSLTGFNRKAFEALLPSFTAAYEQSQVKPSIVGQRAPVGGRKAMLKTSAQKLFYILFYGI
jgi:hypothetical protein